MYLLFFIYIFTAINGQLTSDSTKMLNWCLDSNFHKSEPGPESELYEQCMPWKNRSCCTFNTTFNIHTVNHLNFNFDHCSNKKNMSTDCKKHFIQDFCFYECSPNIGPWVVKTNGMKKRKERFYHVPLCKSECDSWFEDCKYDFTCSENWFRYFLWDKDGNHCIPQNECLTFQDIFRNSTNFCEKIWDHSWKVVDDSESCMKLWFDGNAGNPNDKVTLLKVKQLTQFNSALKPVESVGLILLAGLLFTVN